MNQSSSSSPLTQLPSSSSSSSDNAQHHNAAAAAADSAPPPASSPSSASPALFGTSSSVFEMTNTNAPDLFHHERAGYHSTPVMAATKEQHDPTGMGISGGTMDTDTDTDMQIDMQLQQEKEDSPYPFAFAVPDLQPTSSANTSTSVNDPQERVALNIETQSIGYHAFIPPTNLHNNTNNVNGDSNGNVPTSTYAPAIASFYTPGHAASATSDAYLGMTALAGRGMVEQHAPRHQHQQEGRQYPHLEGLMQTFRQSQSMEHLSPNTPAPLPTVPFVPSMSSYTRAPAQNESPGHARFAGQGGLFVPSMVNDVRGYEELGAYDGGPAVHAASTMKHWSGQRVQQFGSQTPGYQHSQEHQLGHQQHTSVGLSHPMQQHSPALPQQRQNNGSPQGFSGPSFNPFVRPSTNDSSNSVGGYIVNEGQGQDGKYAVGTPMNGEYMRLAPPPTADSSGFDGGAVGDGRCYVPLDSHQRAFTGYGSQPPLQHQAHHQRQDSVDSLLLVHREMEELSTANTTPVFTPSTFPAFLPSTSVVYAPSRRSSRNRQEHRGMFNGEDVEMRESMGPTPSISTERGREETIGAGGYRSPSPKRGRRRGETKPGPNFLTKLYAILNDPAYHHMLHWADDGVQIIIRKPKEMEARVLPLVYKQSKFASFSRQLNIYGFMRKVSMRHVDMARDNDVSVWTHYELNRYSSADKLMSYKRRVGPRHYVRKNGAPAPPAITKMEFPVGVNAGQPVITYEEIAPPAAFKSPQVAFANETPGMPSCHALAFGSPYSVSTNTLSDQSLPETPASVSPVRPIRTHGKSHKMSAGTLPMPSFHERNSSLTYASVGRSVPQNSMASQHSMYPMLGGCAKRVKAENMVDGYSSSDMVQGGLWQSLLGNAGVPHVPQTANNAQFSSCLFPAIGSSGHPLAPASFQPHSGSSYTRPAGTHGQSINPPMMNQMQYVRTFAPPMAQQQQIVYPSGPYAPAESTTHPAPQPSRTMSNSSGSSSMLMTPPRLEAIHIKTEQVDQSPVFGSFSLSLGHASQGIHSGAETGGMDEAIRMQQADQAAENQRNLTIAGNQAFASFLHDMASSPAPSAEVRATPAIAMHGSTPRPDEEDDSTHRMFVNSFETIRPQVAKPTSSCGMQVVIADIETEDDMRYLEETFDSRQIKLADDKAQRHDVSDENVMRKNERLLDEGDRDDGLSRRGGSCMDKTVRQGHDDSASGEFDAWMVVHHAMDD